MSFQPDARTEALMDRLGIRYKYERNIPLDMVKIKESAVYNARFGESIEPERIEQYAGKMKNGIIFPAPVLRKESDGYYILAGNGRLNALKENGITIFDAYIAVGTQMQIDQFVHADNCEHGKGNTQEATIAFCIEMHKKHGIPLKKLNDDYFGGTKRTYSALSTANQRAEVVSILKDKKVDASRMQDSALTLLHPLKKDGTALAAVAKAAQDLDLGVKEITDVVKKCSTYDSEASRQRYVRDYVERAKTDKHSEKVASAANKMERALKTFLKSMREGNDGRAFPPVSVITQDSKEQENLEKLLDDASCIIEELRERVSA